MSCKALLDRAGSMPKLARAKSKASMTTPVADGERQQSATGKLLAMRRGSCAAKEGSSSNLLGLVQEKSRLRGMPGMSMGSRKFRSSELPTNEEPSDEPKEANKPSLMRGLTNRQLKPRKSLKQMRQERAGSCASTQALLGLEERRHTKTGRKKGTTVSEDTLRKAKKTAEREAANEGKAKEIYTRDGPFSSHREMLLHLALTACFTAVMLGSRDATYAHAFQESVRERLAEREFAVASTPVAKVLDDVRSMDEVTQYLRGVLLPAVMDDAVSPRSFDGYVNHQSKMLGAMRLRQVRVATNSCAPDPLLARLSDSNWSAAYTPRCFAAISQGAMRTAPIYGANLDGNGTRRVYRHNAPGAAFKVQSRYGWALLRNYPSSGYVVDIPAQRIYAESVLDQIDLDGFFNLETRAVSVEFTLANANVNMLMAARLVFERLESGGVFGFVFVRPYRPSRYEGLDGAGRRAADVFSILFVCYFMLQEFWEMRRALATDREGLFAYFKLPSNTVDWANICVFWAVLGCRDMIGKQLGTLEETAPYDPLVYYDLSRVADLSALENNLMAINALLVYFKIFKFLASFSQVDTIIQTLRNASVQIGLFLVVFFTVMLAYSCAFFLAFGHDVYHYRGVSHSMISLFRLLLGDIDIEPLLHTNPLLTVFLCLGFVLSVYLMLVNMFLAILSDNYLRARTDRDSADETVERFVTFVFSNAEKIAKGARAVNALTRQATHFVLNYGSKGQAKKSMLQRAKAVGQNVRDAARARFGDRGAGDDDAEEEEEEEDPETWQEQMLTMLAPEEAAVQRTSGSTERLKELYLRLCEGQQETMDLIERVAHAVRMQQHDNALLLNALEAHGVEFSVEDATFKRNAIGLGGGAGGAGGAGAAGAGGGASGGDAAGGGGSAGGDGGDDGGGGGGVDDGGGDDDAAAAAASDSGVETPPRSATPTSGHASGRSRSRHGHSSGRKGAGAAALAAAGAAVAVAGGGQSGGSGHQKKKKKHRSGGGGGADADGQATSGEDGGGQTDGDDLDT